MSSPDAWNVTPAEGAAIQRRLRRLVRRRWSGVRVRLVAGADVHFPERDRARAAIAVLSYPGLEPVERAVWEGPCSFPYIPGLLSFREIPPLLEAWRQLKNVPDLVLCDGQGVAPPRGLGLASHLGLVLGVPTIGCAKSPLYGSFDEPPLARGGAAPIRDPAGRTIGTVLRTHGGTKPLYVSIGHLVNLRTAVEMALSCSPRYRIPEPLRAAHRIASMGR
mgnify:CR=1 FL=1